MIVLLIIPAIDSSTPEELNRPESFGLYPKTARHRYRGMSLGQEEKNVFWLVSPGAERRQAVKYFVATGVQG